MYPTLKEITGRAAQPDSIQRTEITAGLYRVTKRVEWYDDEAATTVVFAMGQGGYPQRISEPSALTLSLVDRIAELEALLARTEAK